MKVPESGASSLVVGVRFLLVGVDFPVGIIEKRADRYEREIRIEMLRFESIENVTVTIEMFVDHSSLIGVTSRILLITEFIPNISTLSLSLSFS